MPGRTYTSGNNSYRYSFNGQEKSDEIKGEGNSYTAKFWEYDPRSGRRWNLDPKPIFGISEYSAFLNNPILMSDVIGDTPRIYGNAEVTKGTLSDKGGTADQAQKAFNYKDARLVPVINPKTNQLVGYNVFDTKNTDRNMPVMQIEPGDMEEFKNNYNSLMGGARLYYSNGEPSIGMKKMAASLEGSLSGTPNYKLYLQGLKQEWNDAIHDPVYVATLATSFGNAALTAMRSKNLVNIRSGGYQPVVTKQTAIKNKDVLNYLQTQQKGGTWIKVYEAAYLNNKKVEVHYFLHKQSGAFYDSKIKQFGWSDQFTKGKNKISGH